MLQHHKNKLLVVVSAIILFFAFNNEAFADGKISGRVTDKASGEGLPGVSIVIESTTLGAITDSKGEYFILNIDPGKYVVRASIVGFQTIAQTNVEVNNNRTTELNFQLSETVFNISQEVVVVAERPAVERDETSTKHYVSVEEISARPVTELNDILNTLPGIDANAQGQLTVRRGSLNQVAFLIDGMRASNPLNYQPYTNVNLTSIQELEIITGGFNAEYGQAQSGVFNIVTKDGSNNFSSYSEFRITPPRKPHWGTAFYDYSTDRYWENTHARHLQWWIDNPNQWVDPSGKFGNDPSVSWTPEQAYENYINTHQPLTDYTDRNSYQAELSLGGPTFLNNMFFFISGKYRSMPPVTGNSFRKEGTWIDGTGKLTFRASDDIKFMFSAFYGEENTIQGMEYMNIDWATGFGLENKYAYYDFAGYPVAKSNGQTLQFTHVLSGSTYYTFQFSRIFRYQSSSTFPGDENGWLEGIAGYDYIRAVDAFGNPIPGGYNNIIGLHSTGYYYRGEDKNTEYTLSGDYTSQISNNLQLKAGGDFTYYILDRFQEAKAFFATEDKVYHPYEGNIFVQSKLEFEGLIMNIGLRYDFYNPNDRKYVNIFDPFDIYNSTINGTTPNPKTEKTSTFSQVSPRLGISHPIGENTVLHFSYGHFFQRASFGDYGEGAYVTGLLNTYVADQSSGSPTPYNLGNRDLKPSKTIAYELGIEHNINGLVADFTVFYKDITNTVRNITVITLSNGRYLTNGNGDYGDAKGVEISINKPLRDYWGGYLNFTWSTGIYGRSGDPDKIAPPGSDIVIGKTQDIGDFIAYDPSRLKFGFSVLSPESDFLAGALSNIQLSLDYQIYFPHERIASDVFSDGGVQYIRPADVNADIRIRKEFSIWKIRPALFVEIHNAFNNRWVNLDIVKAASPEDRAKFINSGFNDFPELKNNGAPFPDILKYRNLPRTIVFGFAIGF